MKLSPNAEKVQAALQAAGLQLEVVELPDSTRTSLEAARAIGCQVGQIAKSIVFQTTERQRPVLVIASGANRVNEDLIADRVGEKIKKADAAFVLNRTGFVIGGVPPVGHAEHLVTFIDEDLFHYAEIWAAAGNPHAVFRLKPGDLLRLTGGEVLKVAAGGA